MEPRRAAEPALAVVAAFLLGTAAVPMFVGDVPVPPPAQTVLLAVGVGLIAALAVVMLWFVLRRHDRAKRDLVRLAVRTGRLPDADDRMLHRILWERSVQLRSWRWSWVAIGATQLLLTLAHLLSQTDSVYSRIFWGLDLVLWIGIVTASTTRAWRERPKVERLLDELDERMQQRADA